MQVKTAVKMQNFAYHSTDSIAGHWLSFRNTSRALFTGSFGTNRYD